MNYFYDLPDDLQEKIYGCAHKLLLKRTFPFIETKPNPYDTIIYKTFCQSSYDRKDLNHFNDFLDYIHGKAYNFPYENVHENRYMMIMDILMNYTEDEDI